LQEAVGHGDRAGVVEQAQAEGALAPRQQLMIDAFYFDKFQELAESGELHDGRPTAIWAEHQAKGPAP
jgi:hypothetical protein